MSLITLSTGREINLRDSKSRKIDREYNEALAKDVMVGADGIQQFPASNMQRANDVLVMWMANLTQAQLDDIDSSEFDEILAAIQEVDQKKSQPQISTEESKTR